MASPPPSLLSSSTFSDINRDMMPSPLLANLESVEALGSGYLLPQNSSLSQPTTLLDSYSVVNVTGEYPFDHALVLFGYLMPFVVILSLVTNLLVVVVLTRRHMHSPTNIVLCTMAIVDLLTLLTGSPWYFYIYTLGHHQNLLHSELTCYAHHIMIDVLPVFFHTASIWLTLLLAGQRYIYVCHPTLASTWCTKPRIKRWLTIILVVAFLSQLTRFFDNNFKAVGIGKPLGADFATFPTISGENSLNTSSFSEATTTTTTTTTITTPTQSVSFTCLRKTADWVIGLDLGVYFGTYFTFRIVFVYLIPCVSLITINCLLYHALKRAEKKRNELLSTKLRPLGNVTDYRNSGARLSEDSVAISRDHLKQRQQQSQQRLHHHHHHQQQQQQPRLLDRRPLEVAEQHLPADTSNKQSSSGCSTSGPSSSTVTSNAPMVSCRQAGSNPNTANCEPARSIDHRLELPSSGHQTTRPEQTGQLNRHGLVCSESCVNYLGWPANADDEQQQQQHHQSLLSQLAPKGASKCELAHRTLIDSSPATNCLRRNRSAIMICCDSSPSQGRSLCTCPIALDSKLSSNCARRDGNSQAGLTNRRLSLPETDEANAVAIQFNVIPASSRPFEVSSAMTLSVATDLIEQTQLACQISDQDITRSDATTRTDFPSAQDQDDRTSSGYATKFGATKHRLISRNFRARLRSSLRGHTVDDLGPLGKQDAVTEVVRAHPATYTSKSSLDSNRTTWMLIVVVTVFLVVELPSALATILHVFSSAFDILGDETSQLSLNYMKLYSNFFIMVSYSLNFSIYCSMSNKFRKTFRDLFVCQCLLGASDKRLGRQQNHRYQNQADKAKRNRQNQIDQHRFNNLQPEQQQHALIIEPNLGKNNLRANCSSHANQSSRPFNHAAGSLNTASSYNETQNTQLLCSREL